MKDKLREIRKAVESGRIHELLRGEPPVRSSEMVRRRASTPKERTMEREIRRLKEWIRQEGVRSDTCTYNCLHEVCEGCRCQRQPPPNSVLGQTGFGLAQKQNETGKTD